MFDIILNSLQPHILSNRIQAKNSKTAFKEIEIIHRLFLVIAMYYQASSSQANKSLNLPCCQLAGHNSSYMQQVEIHQKQPIHYLNFLNLHHKFSSGLALLQLSLGSSMTVHVLGQVFNKLQFKNFGKHFGIQSLVFSHQ